MSKLSFAKTNVKIKLACSGDYAVRHAWARARAAPFIFLFFLFFFKLIKQT
jgi:hypothetical protein